MPGRFGALLNNGWELCVVLRAVYIAAAVVQQCTKTSGPQIVKSGNDRGGAQLHQVYYVINIPLLIATFKS